MHFIELEKLHYSDIKTLKRSDRWIAYLSKTISDNDRKELTEMDSILKDVAESENKFVSDIQLWREYEAREKAIKDEKSHLLTVRLDGIKQKTLDVVKRSLAKGLDVETIADIASVPVSEVLKIQAMAKEK